MLIHSLWHCAQIISKKSSVQSILSDNGTNFVCANNELKKALKERWIIKNSRTIYMEIVQIGSCGTRTHPWSITYRCVHTRVGMPNSNSKRYLRRIAKNTWSIIKWWGTENLDGRSRINNIDSRPLTVETLGDINSQIPHSPSNMLTMKTKM